MPDSPPRALLITRNLPPVIGGMERLIGHVAATLASEYDTTIVGPRGARLDAQPAAFHDCPLSPLIRFLATAGHKSWRAAHHHPDVVLAGSGLAAPIARLAARKAGAPHAVYLHGLDIATPHPVYRRFFVPAIRDADLVIANSQYTARLARKSGIPENAIHILHPGVELPARIPEHEDSARAFREHHDLPAGPILLGVGRITPRKGFTDFVAHTLPAVLENIPDAQFVVAGEVPRHAAQQTGNEAEKLRQAANEAGIAEHVHLIGPLDDTGLSRAWPAADLHVFPVRENPDDPEGFGMAALEAAAWGVPTVAFATGGVPDAVGEGKSGRLIEPGDFEAFARAVIETINNHSALPTSARTFAETFAWPHFDARLLELLATLNDDK